MQIGIPFKMIQYSQSERRDPALPFMAGPDRLFIKVFPAVTNNGYDHGNDRCSLVKNSGPGTDCDIVDDPER